MSHSLEALGNHLGNKRLISTISFSYSCKEEMLKQKNMAKTFFPQVVAVKTLRFTCVYECARVPHPVGVYMM